MTVDRTAALTIQLSIIAAAVAAAHFFPAETAAALLAKISWDLKIRR